MKATEFWKRYGFTPTNTGGNCTALEKTMPDGEVFLITDGEAAIPETTDQPHTISLPNDGGEPYTYANAEDARRTLKAIGLI